MRRLFTERLALCSLGDVAKAFGISRERVRQIEKRALKKLRRAFAKRGIVGL